MCGLGLYSLDITLPHNVMILTAGVYSSGPVNNHPRLVRILDRGTPAHEKGGGIAPII